VGRINNNHNGEWQIVNGMMRFSKNAKMSVTKKQATRLRRKDYVNVVVSRVYPQGARFEVVSLDTAEVQPQEQPKLLPAGSLIPMQELVGTVTRVTEYGVFVDVGANRRGLLHIQKVADLYGCYIDKEQGLVEAGLERGARIRVAVLSNEKKRLFLDFTDDVKHNAETERIQQEQERLQDEEETEAVTVMHMPVQQQEESDQTGSYAMSEEEAAAWAAYADDSDQGESVETDDDYDEERDIEDALGLGTY
jgi:predicted RNA-binding protein with RPS1 domain